MKNKLALVIASLIIGFLFGMILYIFNLIQTSKEFFTYSLGFGVSMLLFELYIRPIINKIFKSK